MVRNDMFYIHYPYIPEIEPNTNSGQVFSLKSVPMTLVSTFSLHEGTQTKYTFERLDWSEMLGVKLPYVRDDDRRFSPS